MSIIKSDGHCTTKMYEEWDVKANIRIKNIGILELQHFIHKRVIKWKSTFRRSLQSILALGPLHFRAWVLKRLSIAHHFYSFTAGALLYNYWHNPLNGVLTKIQLQSTKLKHSNEKRSIAIESLFMQKVMRRDSLIDIHITHTRVFCLRMLLFCADKKSSRSQRFRVRFKFQSPEAIHEEAVAV